MDTQPILDRIREEASEAAEQALAQAGERARLIEEESLRRSAELHERALEDAKSESAQALDRARRLRELEDRKYALGARRQLIDKAFEEARRQLQSLSDQEMEQLMLSLILEQAAGQESLRAGAVNDGFYSPAFIGKANQMLVKAGKPGSLKDEGGRIPGSCGLVLSDGFSLSYFTVDALMEAGREGLEQRVAALLFEEKVS